MASVIPNPRLSPPGLFGRVLEPVATAFTPRVRSRRVAILLAATFLIGMGDLALTLTYATSVGMIESNPIARLVMSHNSTAAVIVWKLALTLFGTGVLFWARRTRSAEVASWVVFLVMGALCFHWVGFTREAEKQLAEYGTLASAEEGWVEIDP